MLTGTRGCHGEEADFVGNAGNAPDLARFFARIREVMDERNLTQSDLATLVGVANGTVTEWFRRGRSPLSEVLLRMPDALEVNGHWLLTGRGPKEPPSADNGASGQDSSHLLAELQSTLADLQEKIGGLDGASE